jgi:hypothetical protein
MGSVPTDATISPIARLISALAMEPRPSAMTLVNPNSRIAKYSGVEKRSAKAASGCVSSVMMIAERRPPPSAATRVHPSAFAACPRRAMV